MKLSLQWILVAIFLHGYLAMIAQEQATEPEKTAKSTLSTEVKVDVEKRQVSFSAEFISSQQMLEVFACTEQGPTHETVFLIAPIGKKLQEGLQKIGLTESIHWQYPLQDGFSLAMGDKVLMKIYVEDKPEAHYAEDFLVYHQTDIPCLVRGWSFKGDQLTVDGKTSPIDSVEISLLDKGRNSSPVTLLLNPSNFFMVNEPEYEVAEKFRPYLKKISDPNKTKVTIVVTPATEEEIVTENMKRYKDETGLLAKNLELAKKIDSLKKKFLKEEKTKLVEIITKGSAEGVSDVERDKLVIEHQKLAFSAEVTLLEINDLYHQMAKNEYEFLLTKMPKDIEETRTFKTYVAELIGFLNLETSFKVKLKQEEALVYAAQLANQPAQKREHELKAMVQQISIDIQPVRFRQVSLAQLVDNDKARLQGKDVAENPTLKETFLKSIRQNELNIGFFKALEIQYGKKIAYLEDLIKNGGDESKMTDDKSVSIEAKVSVLDSVQKKLAILAAAHQERIKNLTYYMEEDKNEVAFYTKKIKETQTQLDVVKAAEVEIQKLIDAQAKGHTLAELEEKFKEYFIAQ